MNICVCGYNYLQPSEDSVGFEDDNTLFQITFNEVFINQVNSMVKMLFVRSNIKPYQ